jgi:hypothetical protein
MNCILSQWFFRILFVPYWVVVVYFMFVGGLLLILYILEWKYYGIKFNKENRKKEKSGKDDDKDVPI